MDLLGGLVVGNLPAYAGDAGSSPSPGFTVKQALGLCRSELPSRAAFSTRPPLWHLTFSPLPSLAFPLPSSSIALSSAQFSRSVVSDSLQRHGLQRARPPSPSPTHRVYSNSCPLSRWCHPTISSSVIPFSSCPQSVPASGSFQISRLFAPGGQRIGASASASVLPMNIQDLFPLGWTSWSPLQSKWLSRVFSNTTVQKHQFFSIQLSL